MFMKLKDVAEQYNIDYAGLEQWIDTNRDIYDVKFSLTGITVADEISAQIAQDYKQHLINLRKASLQKAKEEAAERKRTMQELREAQEEADRKRKAMAEMLITSGFNFDGYTITKYSGYISGDDVIQINRGTDGFIFFNATDVGEGLSKALVKIRRNALRELKEAAYNLGCNAVIGVDFDYITLDPETANFTGGTTYLPYVFCVTANGNAVVIERND